MGVTDGVRRARGYQQPGLVARRIAERLAAPMGVEREPAFEPAP